APQAPGLVAPQAPGLVAPQAPGLVAPQAPGLVAPQAAPQTPSEENLAHEPEKKTYTFKSEFAPAAAESSGIALRSPLAIAGFVAAMMLTVSLAAWGISRSMPKEEADLGALLDAANSGSAGNPDIEAALRPEATKLTEPEEFSASEGAKLVRCAFEYQRRLPPEELQAVRDRGFRIEMWLALDSLPPGECVLAALDEFEIGMDAEGKLFAALPEATLTCPKAFNRDGTLYHVLAESDGRKARLWVNGKLRDEGKAVVVNEGVFVAGSGTANPGVLIDQILLAIGPGTEEVNHPLKAGADRLCYLPFEAEGAGVVLRHSQAPLSLHSSLYVEAADRLKALRLALGKRGEPQGFESFRLPPVDPACGQIKAMMPAANPVDVVSRPGDSPLMKSWRAYASKVQSQFPSADFGFAVPATTAQIQRFESVIGHPLTAEFRELYLVGNGQRPNAWSILRPREFRLLSLEEAFKFWTVMKPLAGKDREAADLALLGADFNTGKVRDVNRWSTAWVPVAIEGESYLCIDYDPTAKGRSGQLIVVTPSTGGPLHGASGVEYFGDNLQAHYDHLLEALKSGALKFDNDGDGPYTEAELRDLNSPDY
ncbi:MAG: hypothetical protein RL095_4035, partial [Verrucomicrobiota bacterium]